MKPIRQHVLERFPGAVRGQAPDDDLADALYFLLWSIDAEVTIDGWALFRVTSESVRTLDGVGLMTLLPTGAVPIAVSVWEHAGAIEWSVRIGRLDAAWLDLSPDKQWNSVYLYATGGADLPRWTWGPKHRGVIQPTPM